MSRELNRRSLWLNPSSLCRMDDKFLAMAADPSEQAQVILFACTVIIICSGIYGFTFGFWRSLEQALYSLVKMPVLFFTTLMSGGMICTMLAQVTGAKLSFRSVCMTVLLGMAVTSVMMASLAPVVLFFAMQLPPANDPVVAAAMNSYGIVLVLNVVVIGFCGIVGNCRVYRLLKSLTLSAPMALRLNTIWILVLGFVGCELSWVISPFLARPDIPVPFFNPNAFTSNFFEYLWKAVEGSIR